MDRLFVLLAAVCFGTTGTAQALGPGASPLAVGAARVALGGAMLALVAWFANRRAGPRPAPRWPARELALGAVLVAVYQLTFFAAARETGVAVGTVVTIGLGPAVAGGLGVLLAGDRLTARLIASIAVAVCGVAVLASAGAHAHVETAGVALAVVSGVGYGGYTVIAKRLLVRGHAPQDVMARMFGLAGILLLPVLALTGSARLAGPGGAALVLYLGAIPTCLAYVCFARGLRTLAAGETALIVLAEPLTAAVLGTFVLGQQLGGQALAGAALILLGLAAPALPAARRAPAVVAP
jgi:DME family drug/metabolite transporter